MDNMIVDGMIEIDPNELENIDGNGLKEAGQALAGTLLVAGGVGMVITGNVIAGGGLIGTGLGAIGNATH